ncbi:MAG: DUF3179 domain-containing protein [Nitriliruptoraceae bacterium]
MRATSMLIIATAATVIAAMAPWRHDAPDTQPRVTPAFDLSTVGYPDTTTRRLHRALVDARGVPNSALPPRHLDVERHPISLVPRERIVSGGTAADAIPSVDHPRFQRATDVDWLDDTEAVLVVGHRGHARAYPARILLWHEIVNDSVAGDPVAVTYCPICNTATAYRRTVNGATTTFGTSGALYEGALVMYDRHTESLWTHLDGRAVVGEHIGTELAPLSVRTVPFATFRAEHPDGDVLTTDTGYRRDYGRNPYRRFHVDGAPATFTSSDSDPRLGAMTWVIGLSDDGEHVAIPAAMLEERGLVEVAVGGRDAVVWHRPGMALPVGGRTVTDGADVGATPAFFVDRLPEEARLVRTEDGLTDLVTGSVWNDAGRPISGPLARHSLEPLATVRTRWFAWSGHFPDTRVVVD